MAWPVLVFDIESIPDIAGLRALRGDGAGQTDQWVYSAWCEERSKEGKSDFMPLHLQRILVISCVFRNADGIRIHSFVDRDNASEGKVIQTFFNTLEKHVPQLVSWNGGGFDLPVLHYRGLRHGVVADKYWYQPKNNAPLDAMAKLCGFPGKLGMDGSQVYPAFLDGKLEEIRRYCETDVMNTYLLYCRFQKMRGGLTEAEYDQEIALVKSTLGNLAPAEAHWQEYMAAWA